MRSPVGIPSSKNFQPFSVKGIAPSSADFEESLEDPWSKQLGSRDDFRDCRAVEEELGAEWMVGVTVSENDVGERWYRDGMMNCEVDKDFAGRG